jgi:hypothetical protein
VKESLVEKREDLGIDENVPLKVGPFSVRFWWIGRYLFHADLTTFPTRSSCVKWTIHLSRQFEFSVLTSDWYALLRGYDLDLPSHFEKSTSSSKARRTSTDRYGNESTQLFLFPSRLLGDECWALGPGI